MSMTVTEWAVECGYISLITNAILGKAETGHKEFQRRFDGSIQAFREHCRSQQRRAEAEGRHDSVIYIEQCLDDIKWARDPFPLPEYPDDRPTEQHPLYQWLVEHEEDPSVDTRHRDAVYRYLDHLGFKVGVHKITDHELRVLSHVHELYGILWMPTRIPHRLDELFQLNHVEPLPGNHGDLYWIRRQDHQHLYGRPTPLLRELIDKAAPIYPLEPEHYYFEVINGALIISYQHIIGSRRLCVVDTNDKED